MGRGRIASAATGWLGIVAVLGNVLAVAAGYVPAKAASIVDPVLGPVVICTAHGPQTLPADGDPGSSGSDASHCGACAVPVAVVSAAVALAVAAVPFPTPVFPRLRSSARTLADHIALGGIRSRAPPLPA